MTRKTGALLAFCIPFVVIGILTGPRVIATEANQVVGAGCPACVRITDCYPGCVGPDAEFSFCAERTSGNINCVEAPFSYPCGVQSYCDQLNTASGDGCTN